MIPAQLISENTPQVVQDISTGSKRGDRTKTKIKNSDLEGISNLAYFELKKTEQGQHDKVDDNMIITVKFSQGEQYD